LYFRKVTQEIFSELDEIKAKHPEIYRSFQKSEEEMERGHGPATQQGGAAQPLVMLAIWLMFTVQLGTPRGRYDEYSSKVFPQ
jgi:hypothetical protein